MKILMRAGLKVGIITGGDSVGVRKRFEDLGVNYLKMGNEYKKKSTVLNRYVNLLDFENSDLDYLLLKNKRPDPYRRF